MPPKKKVVSDSQKKAMAAGRADSRVVKRYLEVLEQSKPKRGRKRSPQNMKKRLAEIDASLDSADPLQKVNLVQERINLSDALAAEDNSSDLAEAEKDFLQVAKAYGGRKGISYAAWREVGVPASTLKAAGISRSG